MEAHTGTRGLKIALAGYFFLLVLQLVSYFTTHVLVLLAIAFETLASILIAALLLFASVYSRKPADEFHMFGYGKAQNVAAVVAGTVFISLLSLETFRQAIPKFFHPPGGEQFQDSFFALIVSAISLAVCFIPIIDILRTKVKGAALKAQLVSSFEDVVAYSAALVGTGLLVRGYYLADPIASIIVAICIALGGLLLFRDNIPYLLGKAPSKELIGKIESAVTSVDGVLGMHNFKAEYVGHEEVHTGFHIEVARGTPIEEADMIVREVKARVGLVTGCYHCVIQIDPAEDTPAGI